MGRVGVSEGMLGRVGEAFWDGLLLLLLLLLGVCGAIVVCVCGFVECGVVWRVGKWREGWGNGGCTRFGISAFT